MSSLQMHLLVMFRANRITMRCRMPGWVLTSGPLPFADAHLSCVLQAPPVPANGPPEGHREDIPPPIRGIAGPGRAQDPHHVDVAYQGIIDYYPQPFAVSDFHRSFIRLPLTNDTRAIEPRLCIPGCRACSRCRRTRTTRCSSA
jgi:hypothetical protein